MQHYKPLLSHLKESIINRAERLEKEMHDYACKATADKPGMDYQVAINQFFILKLAEREEYEHHRAVTESFRF